MMGLICNLSRGIKKAQVGFELPTLRFNALIFKVFCNIYPLSPAQILMRSRKYTGSGI